MEVNALHRKFKRKIQLLKTKKKIEPQKIKEKIEPPRALGTLGLNESGGEERLSPYDSFKEPWLTLDTAPPLGLHGATCCKHSF
jgi:hypothetical protein